MKKKMLKTLIITLTMMCMLSTTVFASPIQKVQNNNIIPNVVLPPDQGGTGNVEVKYRTDWHPIPSVTNYLNAKYGTNYNPEMKVINHINVEVYHKGQRVRDYHICYYWCKWCGSEAVLTYDYNEGIKDLHNCGQRKTRDQLTQDALNYIQNSSNNVLSWLGASANELLELATIFLLIVTAIIALGGAIVLI